MSKIMGVAAAAAPIDPDAEKAALRTLNNWMELSDYSEDWRKPMARALLSLLAQPRLPKEPSGEALAVMDCAVRDPKQFLRPAGDVIYRALYAHLTKPATKKRWGVSAGPQYGWVHFDDFEKAMQVAKIEAAAGKNPVTIEHREVPA